MGNALKVSEGLGPTNDNHAERLPRRLLRNQLGFALGWSCIVFLIVGIGDRVHLKMPGFTSGGTQSPAQIAPPATVVPPSALVAKLRALPNTGTADPPLILTYHTVEAVPRSAFSISPARLQAELAMLRAAGYQSISAARFLSWLDGRVPLPQRAVLVTFDDGLASTWRSADPILRALGFRATAFLITGHIDEGPYYLSSDEVRRLSETGRWSFGAHTADGHTYVSTGPGRLPQAFLVGRRWLRSRDRRETYPEFASRVRTDTQRALTWFAEHQLLRPRLFAYPFSAASSPDHRATQISGEILAGAFSARFLDDSRGGATSAAQERRGLFRRLDVLGTYSLARFVTEATAATPLPIAGTTPLTPGLWVRSSGRGRVVVTGAGVTLEPRHGTWLAAALAPTRTLGWSTYRFSARAFLSADGGTAGISVVGSKGKTVSVSVGRSWFEIREGSGLITQGALPAGDEHRLLVERGANTVRIAIDDTPAATLAVGNADGGPLLFVDAPPGTGVRFTEISVG